ncbi:hypothetical protein SAMN02745121_00248 [Nannocystis exedens]|uniref:Uncharacterized protein n=1 Tax=Nannocystis exedens TaxID=54 RepID=A0A1I1ST00_9BACT|nr:hypothetical protein NAEX_08821 [Nannocystis exedens]SFD49575.1 hypothetical protein SAMN02745121_00248 [Nannocystis exedens]
MEIALGVVPARPSEFGVRLPTNLENLVMRAIGGDPAQRPASAAELGRQLRRLLEPSARKALVPTARAPEPTPPAPALTPVTGLRAPIGPSPALARSSATTARPPVLPASSTPASPRPWVLAASLGFTMLFACTLLAVFLVPSDVMFPTARQLDAQQLDAFEPVPVRLSSRRCRRRRRHRQRERSPRKRNVKKSRRASAAAPTLRQGSSWSRCEPSSSSLTCPRIHGTPAPRRSFVVSPTVNTPSGCRRAGRRGRPAMALQRLSSVT